MASSQDLVLEALDQAPLAMDDLFEDEVAEIRRRSAEIKAGHVRPVDHAEVQRTVAGLRKLAG
jgi:hypothetical protein